MICCNSEESGYVSKDCPEPKKSTIERKAIKLKSCKYGEINQLQEVKVMLRLLMDRKFKWCDKC